MKAIEIVEKIRKEYGHIRSLAIMDFNEKTDIEIVLLCMKYEGDKDILATDGQIRFIEAFKNVETAGGLSETNKYALSACIQIAKDYPYQMFYIEVPQTIIINKVYIGIFVKLS